MLQKQVVSRAQLEKEGFSKKQIDAMSASLKIFPTPFKSIYYAPTPEEKNGWFIDKPLRVLSSAIAMRQGGADFYYSCATAEEKLGIRWTPSNEIHVVNGRKSGRIMLGNRIEMNRNRKTYRASKVAHLLSFYGREIIFHRIKDVSRSKTKQTPYGTFATKAQIEKDMKKFHGK